MSLEKSVEWLASRLEEAKICYCLSGLASLVAHGVRLPLAAVAVKVGTMELAVAVRGARSALAVAVRG